MSYTAIPPQDRALKSSCNGYVKRSTFRNEHSSSLKSPTSLQRRMSGQVVPNSLRKSAPPEHQEIYEGFTFLDEQRRKNTDFCPSTGSCFPPFGDGFWWTGDTCRMGRCGPDSSINPFAFKNANLERIYARYFSLVYRSAQLARFFLLTGLLCLVIGLLDIISSAVSPTSCSTNIRSIVSIVLGCITIVPVVHMHCQRCMRPQHMGFLKLVAFVISCAVLVTVSSNWGNFRSEYESPMTVGLWETIWLIITISCFYPVTFYTLLALMIFLCMSHSIISIIVILPLKQPEFSSKHWEALSGNWLLFIPSILLGSVIGYLQQKMLRNAFLHAREFLNNCVDNKVANEKLDRLLSCIVPQPILTELKQSILTKEIHGQLPSVVHLRNVSFLNVEICGLGRGAKGDGNGASYASDAVKLMNELFSRFDLLGQELGCYQVRIHPDDYLSLAGYPETRVDHAKSCTEFAFRIHQTIRQLCDSAEVLLDVKTVVHTGVTYGAVLGHSRMVFDLLGDDVRVLRYMLGMTVSGKVMVSKATYDQLPDGFKGDPGPRLDLPLMSMSMSSSGDSNRMETFYLRPRHAKKNSMLTSSDLIVSDTSDSQLDETITKHYRGFPVLTCISDGPDQGKFSQKANTYSQSQHNKSVDYSENCDKGCDGHNSRSGHSDSLSSSTNQTITKASAFSKLAQNAKFNANIPYYFLTDDSYLLSSPDDDRLLLDIGGAITGSHIPNHTGSPVFHGTAKSSASWKSTLKSQFTQSLIGSYQIDEEDIKLKKSAEINLSVSKFTNAFIDPSMESKFQNITENYMGLVFLISLSIVLFITGLHVLMLAKTVMLLLIFLAVFMWISLILLLILLIKMKCLSGQIIRSRMISMIMLTVTSLGLFALVIPNSFFCNNTPVGNTTIKPVTTSTVTTLAPPIDSFLTCPIPVYIPLSAVWIALPLIIMVSLPELIKVVIVLCTGVCTCLIVFWSHDRLFTSFDSVHREGCREKGVPLKYMLAIVAQLFFFIVVLWMSRILNSYRRLVFQWQMKASIKRDEYTKLTNGVDRIIDILLPKYVISHYYNPSRNFMSLFSMEYKTIAVLSVSIPSWCPLGVKEPSDVANNIRILNQLLISFDDLMTSPEYDGIIKVRTAGETAWYAVGIDPMQSLENSNDRSRLMTNLLRAAEMFKRIIEDHNSKNHDNRFLLRIGIHIGNGFSGVVGGNNPTFGVWGEAYFGATLVQRCGQLDRIHVTSNFMAEIDPASKYGFYDVGTLMVNHLGQLVSIQSGQWLPGAMSFRVFMLREKNPSHGSIVPGSLVPICNDESMMSSGARRNSLSVVMASGEPINHYLMNSPSMMTSNNMSQINTSNPLVIPRNGAINPKQASLSYSPHNISNHNKQNNMFPIPPITSISNFPSSVRTTSPQQSILPTNVPSASQPLPQILPQKTVIPSPSQTANLIKSPQEPHINRKSMLDASRPKIHHYRNLATELPDSIIPPSPPPHRRIYPDNSPMILPQNHQFHQSPLQCQKSRDFAVKRDTNQMTQSAISPPKERNAKSTKCITPSSSMDSFLELEKACTTNPRTKSANYSMPPNERLSLIPESYKVAPETDLVEDESYQNVEEDIVSIDIMTTSDDRIFDIDQTDIMSHHNPMYTDNEYESMAESQANLLDPLEELRRSRLKNIKHRESGPIMESFKENINNSSSFSSNILPGASMDFPDYRRPSSPNGGINGDDSDHLSKRNRNSSNSRDSSSIAARRSGGATSSDESGKKESSSNGHKQIRSSQGSFSNGIQPSLVEETFPSEQIPLSMNLAMSGRDVVGKGYENGSSCISLVTDLGWTSYDDEEMYSDYPGYGDKYKQERPINYSGNNKPEWGSKWSDSNDLLSSNIQADEDDSDVDCIRFHSDLMSDLSENPLVSDLETETDCDLKSSNPILGGPSVGEDRLNSFYKFPGNNILNPEFFGNHAYKMNKNGDERCVTDNVGNKVFASHPWNGPSSANKNKNEMDLYSLPTSIQKDDLSSSNSSKTPSKSCMEQSKISKLPDIAPVKMPDFGDSRLGLRMGREIARPTVASRFAKKHGGYINSSPERSDYDNVSGRNSLQNSHGHITRGFVSRNSDLGRYNNYTDDSDALSGYVGDVASSVYDSDDYDENPDKRFTQLYLDYEIDNEDPMAPFFPRLPAQDFVKPNDKPSSKTSQSASGSLSGKRSEYDNMDSDRMSDIQYHNDNSGRDIVTAKGPRYSEDYQQQIAEEARRISLVFRNPCVKDVGKSKITEANNHPESNHRIKSFMLNSQRETSVESEISENNCHSYGFNCSNELPHDKDGAVKSRSTECLMTCPQINNFQNCDNEADNMADQQSINSHNQGLSKIIQRAERVRSLLPTELHSYILPGCFSSSSLNSSGKSSPMRSAAASKNSKSPNPNNERMCFSDEERLKQPI